MQDEGVSGAGEGEALWRAGFRAEVVERRDAEGVRAEARSDSAVRVVLNSR